MLLACAPVEWKMARPTGAPSNQGETGMAMGWLRRLGGIALAGVFVRGGWDAARNPGGRPNKVAAFGVPQPELAVRANGALMVGAGVALALGIRPRWAAAALAAALVPTTIVGHPFWQETTPAARSLQQNQFLKNLGLFGGLLLVVAGDS
jgi:putative oxidoreductase